jgi:outer membrane receptor protein involved in Fe transport
MRLTLVGGGASGRIGHQEAMARVAPGGTRPMLRTTLIAASFAATATFAAAAEPVESFPAAFFAPSQPYSAFDMIARLPGFAFDGGDNDIRGLSAAGGNVLVDGKRPSSKQETLETILRRIPADAVRRVELIRAGAPGVDMQGHALLANVVRVESAATRGRVEAELALHGGGEAYPNLAAEVSRKSGDRLLELSLSARREAEDSETGSGFIRRTDAVGALQTDGRIREAWTTDTLEFAAGYERPVAGGALRADLSLRRQKGWGDAVESRAFPDREVEAVDGAERISEGELGLRYDRSLGGGWGGELKALHHRLRLYGEEIETEQADVAVAAERSLAHESILQAVARHEGAAVNLELGGEVALNVLDSRNRLYENDVEIPLPAADVRVEERRAEAFAAATWRPSSRLALEVGSRFEVSTLAQSGDTRSEKSFAYLKPRAQLTWTPGPRDRLRLEVVRRVGQLDFDDFVGSASLSAGTVTAGNPDLEPDRAWRTALAWERQVGTAGSIVLTLRHDRIQDVVDRIPVIGPGFAFDAPGNIGDGTRTEFEANAKLPLDRLRIPGGLLRADVIWRRSRVTDPATGVRRSISDEARVEGTVAFTQDLPAWGVRWGAEAEIGETETDFRFDEIDSERLETRYSVFAEMRPAPAWNVRVFAENVGDSAFERRRERYAGLRGTAPLRRVEVRRLAYGPYVGVKVQRTFGH